MLAKSAPKRQPAPARRADRGCSFAGASHHDWDRPLAGAVAGSRLVRRGSVAALRCGACSRSATSMPILLDRVWIFCQAQRLDFSAYTGNIDRVLQALAATPKQGLVQLRLSNCVFLTASGVACVPLGFSYLQHVDVSHCISLTDVALGSLSQLTELRTLSVACCYELTDNSISQLRGLHVLHFDGCSQITDRAVKGIAARMPALNTLSAGGCFNLTDAALAELMSCPALQILNMRACIELSGSFDHVVACSHTLRTLDLSSCPQVEDAAAVHVLRTIKALESFNLSNCHRLSSTVLQTVMQMPVGTALRELDLRCCPRIAPSDLVASVRTLRPELHLLTPDLPPAHGVQWCAASVLALLASVGALGLPLPVQVGWWHCSLAVVTIGGVLFYAVAAVFCMALAGGM